MSKNIVFLPIWGKLNETIPRQQMAALQKMGARANYGLPGAFFPISRSAARFRPDVISMDWIHQYCLAPGLAKSLFKTFLFVADVLIYRLFFSGKLVWTVHNMRHHDPRPRKLELWVSRFFARNCQKIRVLGKGMESEIAQAFDISPEKIRVIPEGPYIGWYPEGQTREEARAALQIGPEKRVWLYLGTIRPYKGVEQLIAAYQKLRTTDSLLLIAGNPWNTAYTETLKELARDQQDIRLFAASVPDNQLQTFFAASDLVVLPFKNVLNSGSVLLAMGFGKPIVAPRMGLIPFRLCRQPELLFQENQDLETTLLKTSQLSMEELAKIGSNNREEALRYTWDDFAHFVLNEV
jgi:glycosyltransferase involved in cell wall biosynthesis